MECVAIIVVKPTLLFYTIDLLQTHTHTLKYVQNLSKEKLNIDNLAVCYSSRINFFI